MKRIIDLFAAVAGLLILAPAMAAIALAIRLNMGAPVLFRQERLGRNACPFRLAKFRTMRSGAGSDAHRLTPLGQFLRTTSLDELPTLWNVLKGEMSLVGPRPLLPRYLPFFSPVERQRFIVRPGITGLAQIHGRNLARWDDRFRLDVEYVRRAGARLDLGILFRTLLSVIRREDAIADPASVLLDLDRERA